MPWLALPFKDPEIKNLARHFDVQGIPCLVIIGPDDKITITLHGRNLINLYQENAYPFTDAKVEMLEKQLEEEAKDLPRFVCHEGHHNDLNLVSDGNGGGPFICCVCDEQGSSWAYKCLECGYEVHPKCVTSVDRDNNVLMVGRLKSKIRSLNHTASDDQVQTPCKKLKGNDSHLGSDIGHKENGEVNDDFQFLLENDSVKVEEIVKKYSDELSGTLVYMEQQLESLLDAVMLKCRPMTLGEKQKLQRLIQKLPSRNLDRVVEILCRSRPEEEQSCDKIFVDLEKEDNATLWRLYHYVEAVEKAKILSSCLEA
ncbi:hypothetical protein RIF29_00534 [Crotalaria pallida]|uniref:protein-disulfide reductase n=1 Tax=Crotalaria pallida TaxID=3830 RepID=A0AAN9IXK7_CROPI